MNTTRLISIILFSLVLSFVNCKKQSEEQINHSSENKEKEIVSEPSKNVNDSFIVNEYFEKNILKNDSTVLSLEKPKLNANLILVANKVKLEVIGHLNTLPKSKIIKLEVYSTISTPMNSKPIINQKLNLTPNNNHYSFTYFNKVALEKGLYYFILKGENEVIYTGKFQVS